MKQDEALTVAKKSKTFREFMSGMSTLKMLDDGLLRAGLSINDAAKALGISEWKDFRGLTVVDLGCGSRLVPRLGRDGGWPPYYCLLMANLGAVVNGLDISPPDDKDASIYTHTTVNLVSRLKIESSLSTIITPNSVNVVNTNMLSQLQPVSANLRTTLAQENITLDWFDNKLSSAIMTILVKSGVWVNDLETKIK